MNGEALADAARALVGTPFRLHGRDPATGLDCVGVLAAALAALGCAAPLPNGYTLHCRMLPDLDATWAACGLAPLYDEPVRAGDVLLLQPAPAQVHLAIAADAHHVIQAHAALRRVVHGPRPAWPCLQHLRLIPTLAHKGD